MARHRPLLTMVSALAVLLAGCGGEPPPDTVGDSIPAVALPTDTVAADTAQQDTLAAAADVRALAVTVDSLRQDVSRLTDAVARIPGAAAVESPIAQAGDVISGDRVRETADDVRYFGLRTIWAIILLVVAWIVIRTIVWLLNTLAERTAARRLFFKKLIPIVRLLVWTFAAYYIVTSVFNVDRTGLIAATAALGVGIGFAAQGILKNLFGGLIIIFDQPFQVGDKIKVGGTYGEVVSIGMRATRIVTPDDNLVSVPNSQIVEDQVANANAGALDCQVVVDLYLPGWVDVAKAKAIAHAAAVSSRYTYLEKPVVVNVKDEFKETFLTHLVVKAYVVDTRYEFALASDVTESAKVEFLKEGMLQPMTGSHSAAMSFLDRSDEETSNQPAASRAGSSGSFGQ
ncbi:MAG: mechanosensitive ion channel family protein [Gemmatimonadota bacterium]|nr:mechanosensitive ion channel family protein [Gemmatimonadota bacterium]